MRSVTRGTGRCAGYVRRVTHDEIADEFAFLCQQMGMKIE